MSGSIVGLAVFAAWGLGWLAPLGASHGFARADETKALDARLSSIEQNQKTQLRITLGQEICRLYFLRMHANGDIWEQLDQSFNSRQEEYSAINMGQRYSVAECSQPSAAAATQ